MAFSKYGRKKMKHNHKFLKCSCGKKHCRVCSNETENICTQCGLSQETLTTLCCEHTLTEKNNRAVKNGTLDFTKEGWVTIDENGITQKQQPESGFTARYGRPSFKAYGRPSFKAQYKACEPDEACEDEPRKKLRQSGVSYGDPYGTIIEEREVPNNKRPKRKIKSLHAPEPVEPVVGSYRAYGEKPKKIKRKPRKHA
jgi:hypothetical protein